MTGHGTERSLSTTQTMRLYRPVRPSAERTEHVMQIAEPSDHAHSSESTTSLSHEGLHVQDSVLHEQPRIRVLLVDDHAMVRQGLRSVLEGYPDIEVVGEAHDGKASLVSVEHVRPSVIVMDLNMPRMNGIDATAIIKSRYPETIILGLSVNAGEENQAAMIRAGASALLTKEAAVDQLYNMIHEAVATRP